MKKMEKKADGQEELELYLQNLGLDFKKNFNLKYYN